MKLKGIIKGTSILKMLAGSTDLNRIKLCINEKLFYKYSVSKDFKTQLIAFPEANYSDEHNVKHTCAGVVFLLKLDSNFEWVVYNEITAPQRINFGLFGSSMELSQDGKVICIANAKTNDVNNSVFIYNAEGHLRQELSVPLGSSFGNTIVLSKNKKQLLISAHEFSEASDIVNSGKIAVFNLNTSNIYEIYQELTMSVPYDCFGEMVFTNYDHDLSFNKINRIATIGYHTSLTIFELRKDKWYLKY